MCSSTLQVGPILHEVGLNLNSEYNEKNERNKGSHWVALITDDMKRGIYMDSYGEREPVEIK